MIVKKKSGKKVVMDHGFYAKRDLKQVVGDAWINLLDNGPPGIHTLWLSLPHSPEPPDHVTSRLWLK